MKINWVMADSVATDPTLDIDKIKNIGPIWGGWKTWRSCQTDNVICHDMNDARKLISKNFHLKCNMYLPHAAYHELNRPENVKLYQGDFHLDVQHADEIVSMHLAANNCDIVLLMGFDLTEKKLDDDKLAKHQWHVYKNYIRQIIADRSDIQWVILDTPGTISLDFKKLSNLQLDTITSVLNSLGS